MFLQSKEWQTKEENLRYLFDNTQDELDEKGDMLISTTYETNNTQWLEMINTKAMGLLVFGYILLYSNCFTCSFNIKSLVKGAVHRYCLHGEAI